MCGYLKAAHSPLLVQERFVWWLWIQIGRTLPLGFSRSFHGAGSTRWQAPCFGTESVNVLGEYVSAPLPCPKVERSICSVGSKRTTYGRLCCRRVNKPKLLPCTWRPRDLRFRDKRLSRCCDVTMLSLHMASAGSPFPFCASKPPMVFF